jgi:TolB-like protein/DNA-binding winged helix-turn-helix (wHTH) protein
MTRDTADGDGSRKPQAAAYRAGDLVVDLDGARVLRGHDEIALPKLSFDLLATLVRRAPRLISVSELMDEVWPGLVVGPETVSQRIKLVRAALGDDAEQPRYIAGVRGRGYRLVCPVSPIAAQPTAGPAAAQPERAATSRSRMSRPARFAAAAVVLVAIAAAVGSFAFRESGNVGPVTNGVGTAARLAVLPLDNLSPDPADAFFADGLHEELITTLANGSQRLEMISRTTMLSFRGQPARPVGEIAKSIGATHVIEGSVRREADQVRLTLQLIDARTDTHVWSRSYDRTLVSALTLQSEVASDVASQLAVRLEAGSSDAAPRTRDPLAYDLYLKALLARGAATVVDFSTPVAALNAVEAPLSQAIERDPDFAAAYAERVAIRLAYFGYNTPGGEQQVPLALRDLEAADRLAPRDPKVIAARASYLAIAERDPEAAVAAFDAAEAAGLADPQWLVAKAQPLLALRRVEEALRVLERCLSLDPRNPTFAVRYSAVLASADRVDRAVTVLDDAVAALPAAAPVLQIQRAAIVFQYTGRVDELKALVAPFLTDTAYASQLSVDRNIALLTNAEFARSIGELDAMQRNLAAVSVPLVRGVADLGIGQQPVAVLRGWGNLLVGDVAAAAADGREVLRHLDESEATRWNAHYRSLLAAEARTFLRDRERALAAARDALRTPAIDTPPAMAMKIAAVFAWNGADDDAVRLLDALTANAPRLPPVYVTGDPMFTVPLAQSAAFAALVARLHERMRSTELPASR